MRADQVGPGRAGPKKKAREDLLAQALGGFRVQGSYKDYIIYYKGSIRFIGFKVQGSGFQGSGFGG